MAVLRSECELLTEINRKFDKLIGLMAINGKEVDDQIRILRNLNLSWDEIGPLVGMKPDAARIRYTRKASK